MRFVNIPQSNRVDPLHQFFMTRVERVDTGDGDG